MRNGEPRHRRNTGNAGSPKPSIITAKHNNRFVKKGPSHRRHYKLARDTAQQKSSTHAEGQTDGSGRVSGIPQLCPSWMWIGQQSRAACGRDMFPRSHAVDKTMDRFVFHDAESVMATVLSKNGETEMNPLLLLTQS